MLDLIFRSLAANRFVQKALFRLLNEENQRLLGDQSKLIATNERLLGDREKILATNALVLSESIEQQPYMREKGWYVSVKENEPVDLLGRPLPWYTYPSIKYLENHLKNDHVVLEFGSGNSSLWYAERVKKIVSLETDYEWFTKISLKKTAQKMSALEMIHCPCSADNVDSSHPLIEEYLERYPDSSLDHDADALGLVTRPYLGYATFCDALQIKPDIIVVDAYARGFCSFLAMRLIQEGGFIILDNSERSEYEFILNMFTENGYERIDFYGTGPQNHYEWCTSVFRKCVNSQGATYF